MRRKLDKLEQLYRLALSNLGQEFERTFEVEFKLDRAYQSLRSFVLSLRLKKPPEGAAEINRLLEDYLQQIESIQRPLMSWLRFYLALTWPDRLFETGEPESMPESLVQLKKKRDESPLHSSFWITCHRQMVARAYDELLRRANEASGSMNHCFKKLLMTRHLAAGETQQRRQIEDWISGYKTAGAMEAGLEALVDSTYRRPLNSYERRRMENSCPAGCFGY